jgi:hypothetical protein
MSAIMESFEAKISHDVRCSSNKSVKLYFQHASVADPHDALQNAKMLELEHFNKHYIQDGNVHGRSYYSKAGS